jgi:biotin transport system substrate-specific component
MAKSATQTLNSPERALTWANQTIIVVCASLFVALCARFTVYLPSNPPVPLTLQNFGVLLVGLTLGSRRGFAALALYLAEGAAGLPVFSLPGLGGIAQILGPTGGFLIAYPFVAWLAGFIMERGGKTSLRRLSAGILAEILLFASGLSWLFAFTHSAARALQVGFYPFVLPEAFKIVAAAAIATGWQRFSARRS